LAVNAFPDASAIRCALFSGAHVVVVAAACIALLTLCNVSASGLLDGVADAGARHADSVKAARVRGSRAGHRGVHDALTCGGVGGRVIALVGVAQVGGAVGLAASWGSSTADLSSGNSVFDARGSIVASIWWLAFSTSTETTASTAREQVLVTRTSDQFDIDGSKFCEVISAENVIFLASTCDEELISRNITIASDTNTVKSDFGLSACLGVSVIGSSLKIGITPGEVISTRS
jgi:hypothetical protein